MTALKDRVNIATPEKTGRSPFSPGHLFDAHSTPIVHGMHPLTADDSSEDVNALQQRVKHYKEKASFYKRINANLRSTLKQVQDSLATCVSRATNIENRTSSIIQRVNRTFP